MLDLTPRNSGVVRIAAAGTTVAEIAAAIRADYPAFDSVPAIVGTVGNQAVLAQRHGAALTSVGAELLAFFEANFTSVEDLTYTSVARAYAPSGLSLDRGPDGFEAALSAKGMLLERSRNGKWWLVKPSPSK